jgi:hypothetical protein
MRTPFRLSLLTLLFGAFALTLAACASDTEVEPAEPMTDTEMMDEPMPEPAAPAPAASVDVPGTISALQGGITAIPMNAAIDNINGWIAQLEGADFEGADALVAKLEELRGELQATPISGADVAESLTELGRMTGEAATAAGSADLQQLADLLSGAGNQLSSGM